MTREWQDEDRDRVDLSPLDPASDPKKFERHVRGIRTAAAAELLRRQSRVALGDLIVCWRTPILEATLLLACAAAVALLVVRESPASSEDAFAEALGVPRSMVAWVGAGDRPSPAELLKVNGGE